jgi:hypothetical protein
MKSKLYIRNVLFRFLFLLSLHFTGVSHAGPFEFGPGFSAQECEAILKLNRAFLDTALDSKFERLADGYEIYHRTPSLGLDNRADIWIRKDSTAVITLRGTTADMGSILEDFYCAMVPAKGVVKTAKDRSFEYILASDERSAVHAGFLIGFAYLAEYLEPQIKQLHDDGYRKFIIGGHSQGGALCYYFSAWLMQMKKRSVYPDISVKTYASAAPKMGNMYFAYDYDNAHLSQWSFSIVNTADPVPEMPFTTQQVDIDMNEPNPILNLMKRFDELPFFKRIMLKSAFNKMKKNAKKSSDAYQKYLGNYVGRFIYNLLPDLQLPGAVGSTYFVRPGVPIILAVNEKYWNYYKDGPKYFHHGIDPYRFLLREYFEGLDAFVPLVSVPFPYISEEQEDF